MFVNFCIIRFLRFPKDPELRRKWVQAVKRKDWEPTKYSYLCSNHFAEPDFDRTSLCYVRLRENVFPTIFTAIPNTRVNNGTAGTSLQDHISEPPSDNKVRLSSKCRTVEPKIPQNKISEKGIIHYYLLLLFLLQLLGLDIFGVGILRVGSFALPGIFRSSLSLLKKKV